MSEKIHFELVSPEKLLLSTDAEMVCVPGAEGDMGVMAGHMPLISTLRPGYVTIVGGESTARFYVNGGFVEATADRLTVLADEAKAADEDSTLQ